MAYVRILGNDIHSRTQFGETQKYKILILFCPHWLRQKVKVFLVVACCVRVYVCGSFNISLHYTHRPALCSIECHYQSPLMQKCSQFPATASARRWIKIFLQEKVVQKWYNCRLKLEEIYGITKTLPRVLIRYFVARGWGVFWAFIIFPWRK